MTFDIRRPWISSSFKVVVLVVALAAAAVGCGSDSDDAARESRERVEAALAKVQTYEVPSAEHVKGDVEYAQSPPVGGDHSEKWVNCGYYNSNVDAERAVHSMEHGAVWITYDNTQSDIEYQALERLAEENEYVLVSYWTGDKPLDTPVVASAWGRQLGLQFAADPVLEEFVAQYANGPQAPEQNGECTGGTDG